MVDSMPPSALGGDDEVENLASAVVEPVEEVTDVSLEVEEADEPDPIPRLTSDSVEQLVTEPVVETTGRGEEELDEDDTCNGGGPVKRGSESEMRATSRRSRLMACLGKRWRTTRTRLFQLSLQPLRKTLTSRRW